MILVDIIYSDDTLFVNVYENINEDNISSLKTRVFKIARDYDIENIVLNTNGYRKSNYLLKEFINDYESNFNGHIRFK